MSDSLALKCPTCGKWFYWFDYGAWKRHVGICEDYRKEKAREDAD
ncbi:MAG TPA: hypothetical protein VN441_04250 [Syntrophomonas sp.]|nr:hypothetical protein [Syntrophomonas sp.]